MLVKFESLQGITPIATTFTENRPWGLKYDLAKAFAKYLGVRLRVQIADKWQGMIPSIMNRSGDFIAASMTITPKRQQQVAFSDGYLNIQQHIIVHRENTAIRTQDDLFGKDIFVRNGTSYQERLEALQDSGIKMFIYRMADVPTEDLILPSGRPQYRHHHCRQQYCTNEPPLLSPNPYRRSDQCYGSSRPRRPPPS